MPRRARMGLIGAGIGVVLLAATWYLAHYVPLFRRADVSILNGFVQLDRPRVDRLTNFVAGLCDPQRYVFLALIPVIVALCRRRVRLAVMIALVLLCANETTQLLKPLLAGPRNPVPWIPLNDASWPSGHATASMSLALMIVASAPARRRPIVAAFAAAFAIAVCYSFLELGWHYPSDVFGGFLVAATWTMLGIAGLTLYDARRARRLEEAPPLASRGGPASVSVVEALAPMAGLIAVAAVAAALVVLLRPHQVVDYARYHTAFVIGASAIGALGLVLASALTLMLRRTA